MPHPRALLKIRPHRPAGPGASSSRGKPECGLAPSSAVVASQAQAGLFSCRTPPDWASRILCCGAVNSCRRLLSLRIGEPDSSTERPIMFSFSAQRISGRAFAPSQAISVHLTVAPRPPPVLAGTHPTSAHPSPALVSDCGRHAYSTVSAAARFPSQSSPFDATPRECDDPPAYVPATHDQAERGAYDPGQAQIGTEAEGTHRQDATGIASPSPRRKGDWTNRSRRSHARRHHPLCLRAFSASPAIPWVDGRTPCSMMRSRRGGWTLRCGLGRVLGLDARW
ncbi:hypothetical protein NUW54_g10384 [Trametes sanguinea]|uniref:Uncharacterized protein n=1 Tax=Trametes sanguinea TaxID=158606 RepID=A0ACC1P2H7_9APHY|nr:hypothetical protein NUW54_g10384 [Trametes sanguinea]